MIGINNPKIYLKNKYYLKYRKQREKIVDKYKFKIEFNHTRPGPRIPKPYDSAERKLFQKYLKEIGDLLFKPKGNYQKFVWETISKQEKLDRESKLR